MNYKEINAWFYNENQANKSLRNMLKHSLKNKMKY